MTTEARVTEYLARPKPLLIDGRWVEGRGPAFEVHDPATERAIATVMSADVHDVDLAVAAARNAFAGRAWRRMPPADRAKRLWRFADLIEAHAAELAHLETLNQGMPIGLAHFLAGHGPADAVRYYAGWCTKMEGATAVLSAPDQRAGNPTGPAYHAYTLREPLGVVAAITPWNVPVIMATAKLAPALAMGNCVVLKPAELTPLTALRLGELLLEADFPPGVVNIVPGPGGVTGRHLAAHAGVDKVSFTGSTATGRAITQLATGNLKRVALELGGKSPMLVFADADLERTIPAVAEAIFMNSGQICFAGSRLYVERPIYDAVVAGVSAIARRMRVGPGLDPASELGPLVSARQQAAVLGFISRAQLEGATLVTGGRTVGDRGYFVEPTVFSVPGNDIELMREEIFGPVLGVMPFDTLEEAVALANDTPYGLAAGVFTRDLSTAHAMAAEIRAGSVWINCYAMLDESLPNGGFGQSGWGRESGRVGVEEYTELKSVVAGL